MYALLRLASLLFCTLFLLGLTAQAHGATANGKQRATSTSKSRKSARKNTRKISRNATRNTAHGAAHKTSRKAATSARHAKAAPVHPAEAAAKATTVAPQLLERCGFTPASRQHLFSRAVYIRDEQTGTSLFEHNADIPVPIASISKLMTAVVWLEHPHTPMSERLEVTDDDLDTLKFTQSRLAVGSRLTRADMLHIALMSSENRAAAALSRDYPGGRTAFVEAMNAKARQLDMPHTHFINPTGLSPENVSTARELATLVHVANDYKLIRDYSVDKQQLVNTGRGQLQYVNSNRLIRYGRMHASMQKTGFINEAGHNMVLRLLVHDRRPVVVTLLGADSGEGTRLDGVRVAQWLTCSLH